MRLIDQDGLLYSLLYDLDLLPEQPEKGTKEWSQMMLVILHWDEVLKRESKRK